MPISNLIAALKSHALDGRQNLRCSEMTLPYFPAPSFDRSFTRLQASLAQKEQRLRQLLKQSKDRAKSEIRQFLGFSLDAPPTSAAATSTAPAIPQAPPTQAQLDVMFGTDGWLRSTVFSVIGNASHAFMHHANSVNVVGGEHMREAVARPAGQALITVSNHVAAMDDPLVLSAILPTEIYKQPSALRWTLCASDRCFKYASLVPFFTAAKVLPVQRGGGMQQPGMIAAEARLAQGDWVHIFPEGTRSREPTKLGPVRKGIGRLVAAAAAAAPEGTPAPLVVPFVHAGMEKIMPVGSSLPKVGNQVHVVVGEPIPMDDLLQAARHNPNDEKLYTAITARVEQHMQRLHRQVRHLAAADAVLQEEEVEQGAQAYATVAGKAMAAQHLPPQQSGPRWPHVLPQAGDTGLWWGPQQQKEWEQAAFGMWHRIWAGRLSVMRAAEAHPA